MTAWRLLDHLWLVRNRTCCELKAFVSNATSLPALKNEWSQLTIQMAQLCKSRQLHPSRLVVLVPYAQLMQQARSSWAAHAVSLGAGCGFETGFMPRFETTMNWASNVWAARGGFEASPQDIRLDAAIDSLNAAALLSQAGLAAQQNVLAPRLVEAATAVARLAAAKAPDQRLAWGTRLAEQLGTGMESPSLRFELATARIALVWAASSSYVTDCLFEAPHDGQTDFLIVVEGLQIDHLSQALTAQFGVRAATFKLDFPALAGTTAWHAAHDLEDEAERASACVLAHIAAGRTPVGLVAQDRMLTRRVRAMLAERGVSQRDETGWKLSTTRAAATLMSMLRALPWDAPCDAVLDWLKNAPAFESATVTALETGLRGQGVRHWRALPAALASTPLLAAVVQPLLGGLQRSRPLIGWLADVRQALQTAGHWDFMAQDAAGQAVLDALRLRPGAELDLSTVSAHLSGKPMPLSEFTSWVSLALEGASFTVAHPLQAAVVILPLSQLLGRPLAAVVLPGCDELRLPVSPEPPGAWTPAQRALLGLSSRDELAAAQRTAWQHALLMPHLDVLWRTSEGGEHMLPSGFVQEQQLAHALSKQAMLPAADLRVQRLILAEPTLPPTPSGQALAVSRLSASAYEDLRSCPYRFFALRLLRLAPVDELESELGKRDYGNWMHTLLKYFHDELKDAVAVDLHTYTAMLNVAAERATQALHLSESEFLPFAAIWPRARDAYLEWLAAHQSTGAQYVEGEVWKSMAYGTLTVVGKIDRIDRLPDGSPQLIDYKTEAIATTKARLNAPQEDTQLAFYAALLADDTLEAAYVNLGEKEPTKTYSQPDIVQLRDDLIAGMLSDMGRIAQGAPLLALGEGKACEFCNARGLCRKDFFA